MLHFQRMLNNCPFCQSGLFKVSWVGLFNSGILYAEFFGSTEGGVLDCYCTMIILQLNSVNLR